MKTDVLMDALAFALFSTLLFTTTSYFSPPDYPVVVYRGALLALCRCYHPTERWLATLKTEKHSLVEEPLTGAIFESVARRTVCPATNAVRV